MLEINLNPEVAKKRETGIRAMLKAKLEFLESKLKKLKREISLLEMQLTKFNTNDHENSNPVIAQISQKQKEVKELRKEMQETRMELDKIKFSISGTVKGGVEAIKSKTEKITGTVAGGIGTIKSGVSRGAKKKESEIPPEDTPEERKKQKKEFLSDFNDFFDKKDETRRLETEKQAREIFENDRKEKERLEILSEQARTHARRQIELLEKANETFRAGNLEAAQDAQDESYDLDTNLDEELDNFLQKGENIPSDVAELIQRYKTLRTDLVRKLTTKKEEDMPQETTQHIDENKRIEAEIEKNIEKPISDYSEEELKQHLEWLRAQMKWPRLKFKYFQYLQERLQKRIIFIETAMAEKSTPVPESKLAPTPEPAPPGVTEETPGIISEPASEISPALSDELQAQIIELKKELVEKGLSLDNLEEQTSEQLWNLLYELEINTKRDGELSNWILEQNKKTRSLRRRKRVEENKNLSDDDRDKLFREFQVEGIDYFSTTQNTPPQLQKAKEILQRWLGQFPSNGELVMRMIDVDSWLTQKTAPEPVPVVAEGWTEEKERTLQTLLETIEKAKRRIAELDEILETFPKTISLSPKDIEQEISMNLEPLLKKNNAILDEINIVIEGNKLKLEIKFTVKKLGMSFPLSIKAIIGNYYNSITLEDHSYEGSQKDKAKEKLDPQIGNLVPELIKFLEKKYGRKIYNLQIKDSNLEISMEAKK